MMLGCHSNHLCWKKNGCLKVWPHTCKDSWEGTSLKECLASFLKDHIAVHNRCCFGPLNTPNLSSEFPLEKWIQENCYSLPLNHLHHALGKEKALDACMAARLSGACAGPHSGREQPVLTQEGPGSLWLDSRDHTQLPDLVPNSFLPSFSLNCIEFLSVKSPKLQQFVTLSRVLCLAPKTDLIQPSPPPISWSLIPPPPS